MPVLFIRLGFKKMLLVGMLAWVVRYGLFSLGAPETVFWMLATGIILHGICYDFFFVTGQIYVDKMARKEIRGAAQGLLVFVTLGLGLGIGSQISGWIVDYYSVPNQGWNAISLNVESEEKKIAAEEGEPKSETVWNIQKGHYVSWTEGGKDFLGQIVDEKIADKLKKEPDPAIGIQQLVEDKTTGKYKLKKAPGEKDGEEVAVVEDRKMSSLKKRHVHAWKSIWMWPAGMAAIVLVLFGLLFRDPPGDDDTGNEDGKEPAPAGDEPEETEEASGEDEVMPIEGQ